MNKRILLIGFIVILSQLISQPVIAVKAYPLPVTATQPDGTSVTILLHGDEFHHFKTSVDGYLLKQNTKGFLTYATINTAGEIIESDYIIAVLQ